MNPIVDTTMNKDGSSVLHFKNGRKEELTKTETDRLIRKIAGKEDQRSDIVFDKAEIAPAFPGGETKWKQYLANYINESLPAQKGAQPGTYTVIVEFIVDKEGFIHEIKALTHHGFGMENQALDIIKKGPKWVPAMQNGRIVKAYKKQPVIFTINAVTKIPTPANNSSLKP